MRIDIHTCIAVLSLAAVWIPCSTVHTDSGLVGQKTVRKANSRRDSKVYAWSGGGEEEGHMAGLAGGWSHKEHLMLLRQEGGEDGSLGVDCCPSQLEMVEPVGGKNQDGKFVELYSDGENRQRFYEWSCREGVENRPCRFLDRRFYNMSRCVQKYSFSYALVLDSSAPRPAESHLHHHHHSRGFSSKEWKMDYIEVRSGCSCEITPKVKKRKQPGRGKKNHRSKKFIADELDET